MKCLDKNISEQELLFFVNFFFYLKIWTLLFEFIAAFNTEFLEGFVGLKIKFKNCCDVFTFPLDYFLEKILRQLKKPKSCFDLITNKFTLRTYKNNHTSESRRN